MALQVSAGLAGSSSPATLAWLGDVRGHRVAPLGVDRFGQSGNILDLDRTHRLDAVAAVLMSLLMPLTR